MEQVSVLSVINQVVILIGVPAGVAAMIYVGRKLQTLDKLEETTEKIKHNLKVVTDFLTVRAASSQFDPKELKAYSPLQLTPEGKELIVKLGFDKVFHEHKEDFFCVIDEAQPTLKYDVEQAAIRAIYDLSPEPHMNPLKVFFYNNPERNLENTAPTLGVYIRDAYLETHPEIKD